MTMLDRSELPDLIATGVQNALLYARTILPASVKRVDTKRNMVDVTFKSRKRTADVTITDVPIVYFSTQNFCTVTAPVVGDSCLLLISDRDIDAIKYGSDVEVKPRCYDLTDALALIGFSPTTRAIKGITADKIQMRTRNGQCALDVHGRKIEGVVDGDVITKTTNAKLRVNGDLHVTEDALIEGDTHVEGNTRIDGTLNVHGRGEDDLTALIEGDLRIRGTLWVTGSIHATGSVYAASFVENGSDDGE
ncbi:Gp138 family membrane-puncturing spike protein [Thiolapillus sp.]|uniref:Gp138 family membrane-puncturing spike protein n=1 Tax=Thiolapillus sp. TaxID=2017437 RepID=UPI003AF8DE8F